MFIITALFYLWIYYSPYIKYVDYKIYDFFSQKLDMNKDNKNSITPSVVIVEIDKKSIDVLGQWPWSRIITANLINKINNAHPSSIGLNMMFRQKDKSSIISIQKFYKDYMGFDLKIQGIEKKLFDNDKIFADTLKNSKTILPVFMQDNLEIKPYCDPVSIYTTSIKNAKTTYRAASMLCNIEQFHKESHSFGFINTKIDKDGVLRRSPLFIHYKNIIVPAFSLANLLAIDKNIEFPSLKTVKILGHEFHTNIASEVLLSFYEPSWYKRISAIDILEDKISKEQLLGKIVLVGTSLIGTNNKHIVTTGEMLNGTEISATIIENILNDHLLWQPDILKIINTILAFFISIVAIILIRKYAHFLLAIFYILVFSISLLIMFISFQYGICISISYFWVPLLIHFAVLNFVVLYLNDKEQKSYYQELSHSHSAALESMVLVAGTKDFETGAHLTRTKEYMKLLARYMSECGVYSDILTKEFIDTIYHAAPLHDIGKVGIPDAILKKPGKLDENEFNTMKNHPELGMKIIEKAMNSYDKNSFLQIAYNITYYHHERWNGSGYPMGLKTEEIPLEARLMALVDVYDALISNRCYKKAYSYKKAEDIIIKESGKHFDPKIVKAFEQLKDKFKEIAENNN
jgi:adenylate cyclase